MSIDNHPCGELGCTRVARNFAILGARGLVFLCLKHYNKRFPR